MSARGRRRMLGGVAGALLLIGVGLTPPAQVTDAAFTDREYSSATFGAFTVPAPTITSCTTVNNGLGIFQSVTLVWASPYPATGVSLTLTQGATTATVPAANITTTGPVSGSYTHTALLTQGLLSSLLTNLLGSTTTMTARNLLAGTTWVSAGASRQLAVGALGVGSSCT
ncbi:hypothetical protein FQ142_05580 [Microbacterium sp. ANT_H45B]|uniref:hypothetical protein n=1 Tax=Microbacterium sp. ANT_H45B TaxID=2597346 RepID=UPI0011EBE39C|nr:hypothetical protein [Microbacterium sp. ANT_H45B]KAA0962777.1 hypothetical protein FQ142_05580 [Microbacterium sp. ANT_H45B]